MEHLAIIMDGNRRWAKQNGIKDLYNDASKKSIKRSIEFCLANNIKYLSLYAFSLENFNRSKTEQILIFRLLADTIRAEQPEMIKNGVRMRFIGDRNFFPEHLKPMIESAEKETSHCNALNLNILFCYGGQQEIVQAVQAIAARVKSGTMSIEDITREEIENALWTAGIPNPSLIIRTGGVSRLSNFFTYQSAYSEMAFLDCYWPELEEMHLKKCVDTYSATKKNFGH